MADSDLPMQIIGEDAVAVVREGDLVILNITDRVSGLVTTTPVWTNNKSSISVTINRIYDVLVVPITPETPITILQRNVNTNQ